MTPLVDERRAELREQLESFLDADSTTQQDVDTLTRSLKFRPNVAPVDDMLPLHDVEERLSLATRIDPLVSQWRAIHISILMALPMETVRGIASIPSMVNLKQVERVIKIGMFSSLLFS